MKQFLFKRTQTKVFLALMVAVLVPAMSFAMGEDEPCGDGPRKGKGKMHRAMKGEGGMMGDGRLFKKLDLSAEQKAKIEDQRKAYSDKRKALREQEKAHRDKMREAFQGGANEETLRSLHQEGQALRAQSDTLRFEGMIAIQKVLTPEQKKKFGEMKQQMHEKMKDHGSHEDKEE